MNLAIWTAVFLVLGYLSGSVNYAIIVTRLVRGEDIRKIGNGNPGTSNVMRTVGKPWGIIVGLSDALKGVIPMLSARLWVLNGQSGVEFFILYCIGTAAVLGHCRPVFYGFKGGGGIGTMQGVSLFMVPIEYLASMLLGGLIVLLGMKKMVGYKFSRWIPIMFTILTPFVTLATSLWLDIPLFAHIRIGGHSWGTVAGAFLISLSILALTGSVLRESAADVRETGE